MNYKNKKEKWAQAGWIAWMDGNENLHLQSHLLQQKDRGSWVKAKMKKKEKKSLSVKKKKQKPSTQPQKCDVTL